MSSFLIMIPICLYCFYRLKIFVSWCFQYSRYGISGHENSWRDWYVRGGRAIIRVSESIVVSSLRMEPGHLTLTFTLFSDEIQIIISFGTRIIIISIIIIITMIIRERRVVSARNSGESDRWLPGHVSIPMIEDSIIRTNIVIIIIAIVIVIIIVLVLSSSSSFHSWKKWFCLQDPFFWGWIFLRGIFILWRRIFLIFGKNFPNLAKLS